MDLNLAAAGISAAHRAAVTPAWQAAVAVAGAAVLFVLGWIMLIVVVMRGADGESGGEDDSGWGHGGGGSRSPDAPRPPEGDPVWWPEFERQFAAHVERRQAGAR